MEENNNVNTCCVCGDKLIPWTQKNNTVFLICPSCRLIAQKDYSSFQQKQITFTIESHRCYYEDDSSNIQNANYRLKLVSNYIKMGSLLDVGCNFGYFLSVLTKDWNTKGIDNSDYAIKKAKEKFNISCKNISILEPEVLKLGFFDTITMWNVLEHIPNPKKALTTCYKLLKPGGFLFISTPDSGSILAKILGRKWHHLNPFQHIIIFSHTNLPKLLDITGFEVLKIRTLGHYYNLKYLIYKFPYSYPSILTKMFFGLLDKVLGPLKNRYIYLNLGDVAVLCCQKNRVK